MHTSNTDHDETLKEQIENCFIINNMCDCVDEHTSLNLDDTEYFDVERVVADLIELFTRLSNPTQEKELENSA